MSMQKWLTMAVACVVMTVSVSSLTAQQTPPQARSARASDLEVVPSIVYKTVDDQSLDMMLFKPAEKKFKASPLVVYIHGGGWGGGDKSKVFNRDTIEVVRQLSHAGVTCVSIEYRLADGGDATVLHSVADCKDAVRFLVKHANEYGIDPQRIGTFGSSAGGHLTLMAALADDREFPCDPKLDGPLGRIRCVAAYYPLVSFVDDELKKGSNFERPQRLIPILGGPLEEHLELAKKLSPIGWLRKDSPAILLAHGDADTVLSYRNSLAMRDAAQTLNVPVECIISKNAGHGFRGESIEPSVPEISTATVEFFFKYLSPGGDGCTALRR